MRKKQISKGKFDWKTFLIGMALGFLIMFLAYLVFYRKNITAF